MRILLVEDNPEVITMFRDLTRDLPALEELHAATDQAEFHQRFELDPNRYDVIVMDLMIDQFVPLSDSENPQVPISGFKLIKEVLDRNPTANIAVHTQFRHEQMILHAFRLGARCFMSKIRTDADTLLTNLVKLSRGELIIDPGFSQSVKNKIIAYNDPYLTILKDDQIELIELLLIDGMNVEAAAELLEYQSAYSVNNKVSKILKMIGFKKRRELLAHAKKAGLKAALP
ncbi:MAG: response regulator transcription factor [Gammaproteobacteria bacterium]|nr:response regulator transcription factor [Gammaproteobacteria bacterium]